KSMSWMVLTRRAAERPRRRLRLATYRSLHRFPVLALPFPVPWRNRERIFPVIFTLSSRLFATNFGATIWTSWFFAPRLAKGARFFHCFSPDNRGRTGKRLLIRDRVRRQRTAPNAAGDRATGRKEMPGRVPGFGFAVKLSVDGRTAPTA